MKVLDLKTRVRWRARSRRLRDSRQAVRLLLEPKLQDYQLGMLLCLSEPRDARSDPGEAVRPEKSLTDEDEDLDVGDQDVGEWRDDLSGLSCKSLLLRGIDGEAETVDKARAPRGTDGAVGEAAEDGVRDGSLDVEQRGDLRAVLLPECLGHRLNVRRERHRGELNALHRSCPVPADPELYLREEG